MKNKKLSKDLKKRAIALGLCSQWTKEWKTSDCDELCQMYKDGIDFCIEHDYPTTEYMKDNFEGIMQKNGIYVDDKVNINKIKHLVYVFNGGSNASIKVSEFDVCEIYVRHDSVLNLECSGQAKVYVNLHDNAKLNVKQEGSLSRCVVSRYSPSVVISHYGDNVRIRDGKVS